MEKVCTKCGEEKPLEDFHRRADVPDGRASWCKACDKAKSAAYYKRNREQILAKTRAYEKADRARRTAIVRSWRQRNPDKVRAANQRAIKADPEAWRERSRRWDRANPDKVKARIQRRRARLLGAFVADVVEDEIILRDEGRCGICGEPVMGKLHIDHVIPLAAEGTHEPDNVQLAHPLCNHRKSARVDYPKRVA